MLRFMLPVLFLASLYSCSSGDSEPAPDTSDSSPVSGDSLGVPDQTGPTDLGRDTRDPYPLDDLLRMNQLQMKGTHNSYHLGPMPGVKIEEYQYSHAALDVQLGRDGVRQFELDIHTDEGEGITVYHIAALDSLTSCRLFTDCMTVIKGWSDANPLHHPIVVMLEPKYLDFDPTSFNDDWDALEADVLKVWPRERVIAPDDVRGDAETLREAVTTRGWPTMRDSRGKIVFFLLKGHGYLESRPGLKGALMFLNSSPDEEHAGIMAMDHPQDEFDEIQAAVQAGFLVRTRADSDLALDPERFQAALDSGAQMLSSDMSGPSDFRQDSLVIPQGTPSRCNPLTGPEGCTSADVENLGL